MSIHTQYVDTKPQISVIIPVYNDADGLRTTLDSLSRQLLDRQQYEVIVANDGGSEDICNICERCRVKYINIIPNQGSYNARNKAIQLSTADTLAFTDADVEVPQDWLINGLNALRCADYIAGPIKITKHDSMGLAELYEYYTAFNIKRNLEEYHYGVTANLFVKKIVFEKVGLFENRLRSSGDLEFGNRVFLSKVFKQAFSPEISVNHPPRGYDKYIKKIKRVCEGQVVLTKIYPQRFPAIRPSYSKSIMKMLLPPNIFKTNLYKNKAKPLLSLYFFHWYLNMLRGYYTLRALNQNK